MKEWVEKDLEKQLDTVRACHMFPCSLRNTIAPHCRSSIRKEGIGTYSPFRTGQGSEPSRGHQWECLRSLPLAVELELELALVDVRVDA